MSDLQDRLTAVTESAANLVAQLTELNHLREQVRKAQLFQLRNRCDRNVGMGTALSHGPYWEPTAQLSSASTRRERTAGHPR
jgi:hypothetical protein